MTTRRSSARGRRAAGRSWRRSARHPRAARAPHAPQVMPVDPWTRRAIYRATRRRSGFPTGRRVHDRQADPAMPRRPRPEPPSPAPSSATKVYGQGDTAVRALDDVTVDFATGRFTAIMGPSGSGKSTLMHCVAGLDSLTSGAGVHRRRRARLPRRQGSSRCCAASASGFVFQAFNLIPTLTRHENITLPIDLAGRQGRPGVDRPGRRHRRPRRPPQPPARRSSRAASSSGSPSPGRWPASRRSSSPTSPPATSTRAPAPRSSTFMRQAVADLGQTIVMVTHDPVAAGYADHVAVPRRRPHRRRDGRADGREGARPHEGSSGTADRCARSPSDPSGSTSAG